MKKTNDYAIFLVVFTVCIVLLSGCDSAFSTNDFNEVFMSDYYKIEDFQFITIGETTYKDVYKVASPGSMQITSYGGFCEYPMQNGGCVRIKFYGKNLVVGAIEEIP